ncbi:MAG TPA: GNAT family protein [Kofleriaceae bacterium]|nr:GNAT family protein [Kofleriaceae bacterium]
MVAQLPDEVLARRAALPKKPAGVSLSNERVTLRPLELARDLDALFTVASEADWIWQYMFAGPFADEDALGAWLRGTIDAPDALPFTVFAGGAAVGVACYVANAPEHLKIELGSIWYGPRVHGTGVSPAATYLLIDHAIALGYRRVEWKCDALNERSRRAATRMGFTFEGVQDAHLIVKNRNRDTAWFRILDHEWPAIAPRLKGLF